MRYFIYCRKSSEGEERQALSLASQQEALAKTFGATPEIEIVGVYEESKSAKTPGRPLFAEMLKRIEEGEADGIASWAPDRLARNSIDGGHIIYLLDRGVLRDLKFATYTFENNPQGKFMLGIMFNQSKYYSDALSENVKRGNATKAAMGWRPSRPPVGYLTCPQTRTVIPDPHLFPLVQRMFKLLLAGNHSPREITLLARDEWGMRTRKRNVRGGTPLSLSAVYKLFANPFYRGHFLWDGELYQGKHEPMVSPEDFARVQTILKRDGAARPQKHSFPFTGLVRCGNCGLMVTAEIKRNDYNSLYIYYHCTRRGLGPRCREPAATADQMEAAFADFLGSIHVPHRIESWVRDKLRGGDGADDRAETTVTVAATTAELTTQLQELNRLRIRRMIDDAEYVAEHSRLAAERDRLLAASRTHPNIDRFELFEHVVSFSKYAVDWFCDTDPDTQRLIARTVGSNFLMTGKKLSGEAVKPFQRRVKSGQILQKCALGEDVRTKTAVVKFGRVMLRDLDEVAASPEGPSLLSTLRTLNRRFGVEVVGAGCSATRRGGGRTRRAAGPCARRRLARASRHTHGRRAR